MLRPTAALTALVLALGATGCGGDDPDHLASGDDFSVEAALAELPAPEVEDDARIMVTVFDLAAVAEANDAGERPDDDAEGAEWFGRASGAVEGEDDEARPVFVAPAEVLGVSRAASPEEMRDELGFTYLDVDAVAEVVAPPARFAVVTGELGEDTFADAGLEPDDDGIVSIGEGEDGEADPADASASRPAGAPLRGAADADRLALGSDTDAVAAWAAGEAASLAEDEGLRGVAAALDEADAVSATLARGPFDDPGGAGLSDAAEAQVDAATPITEPFSAVGIGWAADGGDAVVTVAWAFEDDDTAEGAVEGVEAVFTEGASLQTRQPFTDLFIVDEVTADGAVVVARLGLTDEARPPAIYQMLLGRDLPFVHR